jgi:hypothetical protein
MLSCSRNILSCRNGRAGGSRRVTNRGGNYAESESVRVRVTLRLTVSQSVCLGVEPNYGTFDHRLFICLFSFESYSLVILGGAPSLTRGRVCLVSVLSLKSTVVCHLYKISTYILQCTVLNTFTNNNIFKHIYKSSEYIQFIQASFSPGFVQQIMSYLLVS